MESVNAEASAAFLQLTNYFAENASCQPIKTLADLWDKHGPYILKMLQCNVEEFEPRTSDTFYHILIKKLRFVNGTFAESLNNNDAAAGNLFEIAKFYTLFLEYLRKEQGEALTKVLESMSSNIACHFFLQIFAKFDKMYEEDTAENWWSFLEAEEEEDEDITLGFVTPTTKRSTMSNTFATPSASTRRLRSVNSSARRSPIVEAIDSPTMRFMRNERDLKQMKKQLSENQTKLEEMDTENVKLLNENRDLKQRITDLQGNSATTVNDLRSAEKHQETLNTLLETATRELESLRRQLSDARQQIKTATRTMEEMEKDRAKSLEEIANYRDQKDLMMKQLRELRESNESDFTDWKEKEVRYEEALKHFKEKCHEQESLIAGLNIMKTNWTSENERLTKALESSDMEAAHSNSKAEKYEHEIEEMTRLHSLAIQKERNDRDMAVNAEQERLKRAEKKIERLERELVDEKKYKNELNDVLDSLNKKALNDDLSVKDRNEEQMDIRACLQAAKQKIAQLEVDITAKTATIVSLEEYNDRLSELLQNEQGIRDKTKTQHLEVIEMYEKKLSLSKANLEEVTNTSREEIEYKTKAFEDYKKEANEKIAKLEEELSTKTVDFTKLDMAYQQAKSTSQNLQGANNGLITKLKICDTLKSPMRASADSLPETVEREDTSTIIEIPEIAATPRKSCAFPIEWDTEKKSSAPPGFKLDMPQRQSITSLNRWSMAPDDTFDRTSLARASIRSDSTAISSASTMNFKQPFTPSETNRERVSVLQARNQQVKPHNQCSYAVEMGDVSSPSASEKNIKKGTTKKPSRLSLGGSFFNKKKHISDN